MAGIKPYSRGLGWVKDVTVDGLTNPKNKLAAKLDEYKFRDTVFKLIASILNMTASMLEHVETIEIDPEKKKGFRGLNKDIKDARDVFGILGGIGTIPRIVASSKHVLGAAHSLYKKCDYVVKGAPKASDLEKRGRKTESDFEQHFRVLSSQKEKALFLAKELSSVISSEFFFVSFCIMKPIKIVSRNFPSSVSASAKSIGNKFTITITVVHLCTVVSSISELVRAGVVHHKLKICKLEDDIDFYAQITKNGLKLLEMVPALSTDIINLAHLDVFFLVLPTLDLFQCIMSVINSFNEPSK